MRLLHGSRNSIALHVGLCLTDSRAAAIEYARDSRGQIAHLTAVECEHETWRLVSERAIAACRVIGEVK